MRTGQGYGSSGQRLLTSFGWVLLSIWLLDASCAVNAFWKAETCSAKIVTPIGPLPPNLLMPCLSVVLLPVSWPSRRVICHCHESICILRWGRLSLHAKWVTRCNAQSSAYYNDLSLLVFSEPPLGGAIVHSCVFLVYTNIPSQPMYEPNLGSCLYQLVMGGKLWSHSCKLL